MSETIATSIRNVLDQVGALPSWDKLVTLVVVLPAAFILLELCFPARPRQAVPRRSFVVNLVYWFFNPLVMQVASKVAVCLVCLGVCLTLGWDANESILDGFGPVGAQPLWLQALEMLVIADFIDYWTHRWFHVTRFWRFHAIHHSPEQMNWLASARMHPVNDFITRVCQVIPVILVGFSLKAVLIVVPFLVFFVIVLHSNLNWDYGPFRWVLVSPLYHRWHHTTDPEGLDKNFAGIFPIWDVLFGTAHFPRREPAKFGVNHNPPPESFWGQLLYPFRALSRQRPEGEEPNPPTPLPGREGLSSPPSPSGGGGDEPKPPPSARSLHGVSRPEGGDTMSKKKVRYAVVGTGWFAQDAILPAFQNAEENSQLAAIVSGDPVKQKELGERYGVSAYDYQQYGDLLESGTIDAVFIALPNSMHKEYTVRAAKHGVHVLTEKPMAATADECREMIAACDEAGVKLMVAYRLHFESGNLTAIDHIKSGKIGEPRLFTSLNTQQVEEGNTRLDADLAGSPLLDIGIYCINAARYLFQDDPVEVSGFAATNKETRFREVPEMVSAVMRFPKERLATFTCGFGEAKVSEYRVVGTTGDLRMDIAYTFRGDITMYLTGEDGKTERTRFPERDQVGPEIAYFSDCVLNNRVVEPSGLEGLADMMIIEAIEKSCASGGRAVKLDPFPQKPRPSLAQEYKFPKIEGPELVNASSPGG